jgi:hypothetical protein
LDGGRDVFIAERVSPPVYMTNASAAPEEKKQKGVCGQRGFGTKTLPKRGVWGRHMTKASAAPEKAAKHGEEASVLWATARTKRRGAKGLTRLSAAPARKQKDEGLGTK